MIDVDEFLALRKEVRNVLKNDAPPEPADSDAPPGDEDQTKAISSDEETKSIRERIVSIRRKIHKNTVNAVTARWNYEEGVSGSSLSYNSLIFSSSSNTESFVFEKSCPG